MVGNVCFVEKNVDFIGCCMGELIGWWVDEFDWEIVYVDWVGGWNVGGLFVWFFVVFEYVGLVFGLVVFVNV